MDGKDRWTNATLGRWTMDDGRWTQKAKDREQKAAVEDEGAITQWFNGGVMEPGFPF